MEVAKVFKTGRSQAIRLPKDYRFDCEEVLISRVGKALIITKKRGRVGCLYGRSQRLFRRFYGRWKGAGRLR